MKFRRQHSLGNIIVDFFCPEKKLVIELDGDYHGDYLKIEEDVSRDNYLRSIGYRILRFENRLVFQDLEFVIEEIRKATRS